MKCTITEMKNSLMVFNRKFEQTEEIFNEIKAGFRKGRGTRDQIANIHWIMGKAREFQKNIYFCFLDYAKAFDCGSQ